VIPMLTSPLARAALQENAHLALWNKSFTHIQKVTHMPKIRELAARYQAEEMDHLADRTHHDYCRNIEIICELWGDRDAEDLKARELGQYMDVRRGRIQRGKVVTVLANIYRLAVAKWYVIEHNPTRDLIMPKSKPRTRYVTDAEYQAVRGIASPALQIAMDLAYITGQRQGDIVNMTWEQIEAEPGPESYGKLFLTQGKTSKQLAINITEALKDILLRARKRPPMLPRLYVVRTRTGEGFSSAGMRALWQRTIRKALRLKLIESKFTFHDLRAKCASDNLDIQAASNLLGHQNVQMTKTVYDRSVRIVEPLR
jgi:integrase